MPPKKRKASAPPRRPPSRLEYQASDGAWYTVRLALQGGSLRVMYEEFLEEKDEWYDPGTADVAALLAKIRPLSPPLDDARCGDLRPGQRLCVFCDISELDRKYYDAVLDSVRSSAVLAAFRRTYDLIEAPPVAGQLCRLKERLTALWTARSYASAVSRCNGRRGSAAVN
jgi:hypothetical protein